MNHFDAAYLAAAPFFLANAAWKRWRKGKYRRSLPGMFGANLPGTPLPEHCERVWMHSVSVGETIAAGAVFRVLKEKRPDWQVLSTTTTETGQDQAKRSLAAANHHDFAPIDFSWKVRRFLRQYRPSVYLLFETEIWPNVLLETGRAGIPVYLVNGKLSARSARRYEQLRRLLAGPLASVSHFLMQTEADAERMRRVVGPGARIDVTGNVKFDNLPAPLTAEERAAMRREFGIGEQELLFLAGSTHPGEEKLLLESLQHYQSQGGPPARLMIAPRHPERFAPVAEEIRRMGYAVRSLSSQGAAPSPGEILILNRMGVLGRSFGAADVALVGGAWNPIGGHNLLEPAVHGIPVVHGPHMHEQKEILRIVSERKATLTTGPERLAETLLELARNPDKRAEYGRRGADAARENAGAAHRAVDLILADLDARRA